MDVNCYSGICKCIITKMLSVHSRLNSKQNTVLPVFKMLLFYNSESVSPFADLGLSM